MTAIEEAKDLNTLSVEDLISSLKCHEIGLNEHEPIKKSKSIALKSRGKSSKALKALESKEESTSEDSDEDPEIVQEMAMLTNRLQYLAKKNKKYSKLFSILCNCLKKSLSCVIEQRKSLTCVFEQLVISYYILVKLSLEVQGGQDYFRIVEGTCINCLCSSFIFCTLTFYPLH